MQAKVSQQKDFGNSHMKGGDLSEPTGIPCTLGDSVVLRVVAEKKRSSSSMRILGMSRR